LSRQSLATQSAEESPEQDAQQGRQGLAQGDASRWQPQRSAADVPLNSE
jgi:hypothetical protein